MAKHTNGSLSTGKSQFLWEVDVESAVLDAAAYADEYDLWDGSTSNLYKAKVRVLNGPVGVLGDTGELTDYINIYRRSPSIIDGKETRLVHGSPGNPP